MFLSDYSQTQSPNGRMFCIRFVEIFFRGGGQQNISHPPTGGGAAPSGRMDRQISVSTLSQNPRPGWATEYSQTNIKIFVSNLSQIFSQTKTQNPIQKPKNHSHFGFHFVSKSSSRVGNRNPLQMFHLQIRNFQINLFQIFHQTQITIHTMARKSRNKFSGIPFLPNPQTLFPIMLKSMITQ